MRVFVLVSSLVAVSVFAIGCSDGSDGGCGNCDDGVGCTEDTCDLTTNRCRHEARDDLCPAGERCDPEEGCVVEPACTLDADCDDANPCTDDGCTDGSCQHADNTEPCDDGDPCTEGDRCSAGACVPGQNVCGCTTDADCAPHEDGDLCNGTLVCIDGSCEVDPDTVVSCDPAADTACARNTCAPASGTCSMTDLPDGTACDDGDPCTTGDACSAGVCAGAAVDCSDGDACTSDACSGGDCLHDESCCGDGLDNDGDGATDCDDGACEGDPACSGECKPVPDPAPVDPAPLPAEDPPGQCETLSAGGFTDDYLYDNQNYLKVGTRRAWGGTIVFYGMVAGGPGMNGTNTIDANDTGREVQVAFYDPDRAMQNCAWNASCRSEPSDCPGGITYLGWNPVQGGNRCNRGSGVEEVTCTGGVLSITLNPLFWNPNWDRQDCSTEACDDPAVRDRRSDVRVIQTLRFIKQHVVELDYTVINLSDLDHGTTAQEMPTVYTANGNGGTADLWRLFDSEGTEIPIDTPAGGDGFYYENFESPGGWAAMQNDDATYGVGLYTENRITAMQGWQLRSLPFNNFRPVFPFAIPPHGTVRARAYLLLGSLATIAAEADWLDTHLPPFGCLDAPLAEAELTGVVNVHGWALDNKAVTAVELVVDGTTVVPLTYGTDRPDVCRVWPGYPGCSTVGFSGSLDTSTLTPCQHLIELRARDAEGNQKTLARRRISVIH